MKFLNRFLLIITLLFVVTSSFAQGGGRFRIKGAIKDSIRAEGLEFATAALTKVGEETPVKYALTDEKGEFEITGVAAGDYIIKFEFMGFEAVEKKLKIGERRILELGNICMLEEINLLDQVVVSARGNPVVVKKDTIEYTASMFKTTDSDMLESLLKKLPGIEIDSDGKITANGKEIDKIMIDGKTFFLDDPTIATKNLPANIVDKVRVVDRKSEQARFTGIDDGNEETVIDLTIKPGMMNGWFGNLSAGYGTRDRYQGNGLVANFTEKRQLSAIGNINNTNNRSFGEMARGMSRGGGAPISGGRRRVRVGGTSFNIGGSGITSSWMGGLNGHTENKSGSVKFGGNLMAGGTDNVAKGLRSRQTFLQNESSFFNRDTSHATSFSDSYAAGLELEVNFSDKSSLLFRPRGSYGSGSSNDEASFATIGGTGTSINDGRSLAKSDYDSKSFGGDLLYRQRLNIPGRTFSINFTYNLSENETRGLNKSETNLYKYVMDDLTGIESEVIDNELIDQKYLQGSNNYNLGVRASYTEPLWANHYMEAAYSYNFNYNDSKKEAFNLDGDGEYTIKDDEYSNIYENTFINQTAEVNVRKNEEKYSYHFGVSLQPSFTKSLYEEDGYSEPLTVSQNVINFSPSASVDYRFEDRKSLRLNYRGRTSQPTVEQLQPVRDNKDPLFIQLGNPDLLPEFSHNLWFMYRNTNSETFSTISMRLNATYTQDKIINKTTFGEGGVRTTIPVNEDGVYSVSGNFMWSTPIARSNFHLFSMTRLSFNNGVSYTDNLRNLTQNLTAMERLRFTYRGEKIEASLLGSAAYTHAWYSVDTGIKTGTWRNSVGADFIWTLPAGFTLKSDIDHRYYIGYAEGLDDPVTVWNGEFSKLLFKNKATLTVAIYDILNQANTLVRNITDNYIEELQNNTLQRYVMFSFSYRFGSFGQRGSRSGHTGYGRGSGRGYGGRRF